MAQVELRFKSVNTPTSPYQTTNYSKILGHIIETPSVAPLQHRLSWSVTSSLTTCSLPGQKGVKPPLHRGRG